MQNCKKAIKIITTCSCEFYGGLILYFDFIFLAFTDLALEHFLPMKFLSCGERRVWSWTRSKSENFSDTKAKRVWSCKQVSWPELYATLNKFNEIFNWFFKEKNLIDIEKNFKVGEIFTDLRSRWPFNGEMSKNWYLIENWLIKVTNCSFRAVESLMKILYVATCT